MREIGRAIVSGRYPEFTPLPGDAELMAQFGVSRTVLREAMKTLSGKGLLHAKAHIGTRVRARATWNLFDADVLIWHAEVGFDAAFLVALNEMRLALEPEAAALAAGRRTPEQLEALYGWVDRMGAEGVSPRQFVEADLEFHLAVATAAGNPFLRSISTLIEVALVAALTRSSPVDEPGGVEHSAGAHRAIADAIARRDAEAARRAMRIVIGEGVQRTEPPGATPPRV
jgi:DNA-binding FadR family transcriptional regulator